MKKVHINKRPVKMSFADLKNYKFEQLIRLYLHAEI